MQTLKIGGVEKSVLQMDKNIYINDHIFCITDVDLYAWEPFLKTGERPD